MAIIPEATDVPSRLREPSRVDAILHLAEIVARPQMLLLLELARNFIQYKFLRMSQC